MCSICKQIANITSLDLSGCAVSNVPPGCFAKCKKLENLNLMSNTIETLANGSLKGLKNLETLNLNNNMMLQSCALTGFEELKSLDKLKNLSMRNNAGSNAMSLNYTCLLCGFLPNVTILDLSENKMNRIPPSCFAHCLKLKKLYLDKNNISEVVNTSFAGLNVLKVLTLDDNRVIVNENVSNPDLFEPLKSLEELHIQRNTKARNSSERFTYLANIRKGSLTKLQILFLDGLPNGVFSPQFKTFKHLTTLNFSGESSYCYVFSLTNLTFHNIFAPSLESIHLSHCNISTIDADSFTSLVELKYLNLSYNMALGFPTLRNVSYGLQFTKIKILDYSKVYRSFGLTNQITRCDLEFLQNTTLEEFHVNNNRLASVEINAFMWLPLSLKIVYAEENQIQFGNYAFQLGCLCNLTRLEVGGQYRPEFVTDYYNECGITDNKVDTSGGCHINRSVCEKCRTPLEECPNEINISTLVIPDKLETLNVRTSNIHSESTKLTEPFSIRNNLRFLDISDNVFHSWTEPMILVDHLKLLNLSNNFGSNISRDFFRNCPNLEHLDASNNRIGPKLVEDANGELFQHLKCLKYLNISNNWIEYLPSKIFQNTPELQHLDLSSNRLKNVSFDYTHLVNLSYLNLKSNGLSTVPLNLLNRIASNVKQYTSSIDLSDNRLDGSCKNIEFLSWLKHNEAYFAGVNGYRFFKEDGSNISFSEMSKSFELFEKHCHNYTAISVVALCFILIFILVTVGGILQRYRWRISYLYYMAKARYGGYVPARGNEDNDNYQYDMFISYANDDYRFVTDEMYNNLDEMGISMCLHQKDFLPGSYIAENILRAIKSSRKTVIILSPAFLDSKWCMYEFNMARMEGLYGRNGESIIFIVMYEEIDITRITDEMRECLESESYLSYPKEEEERPYFWEMLTRTLSDTRNDK